MIKTIFKNKQVSLKTTVVSLFFLVTAIISVIFIAQLLIFTKKLSYESIDLQIQRLVESSKTALETQERVNQNIVELLAHTNNDKNLLYTTILQKNPMLYAVYTGYADGGFYEIINFDIHPSLRKLYGAKQSDRWLLIIIDAKDLTQKQIIFLNTHLEQTASRFEKNEYDPRKRPWFIGAMNQNEVIKTKPYAFSNIPAQGITYAKYYALTRDVVAIDVLLYDLKTLFEKTINKSYMDAYLFNKNQTIISSLNGTEVIEEFFAKATDMRHYYRPKTLTLKNTEYVVQIKPLHTANGEHIALFAEYDEAVKPYKTYMFKLLGVFLLGIFLIIPFVIYLSKIIVTPIYELIKQSKKVKKRRFNDLKLVQTPVLEVAQLSSAMQTMAQAIHDYQTSLEQKVRQRTKELDEKNKELLKLSVTDKLTGLYNRVKLDDSMINEYAIALRYDRVFSIILLDIDFFKQVNDIYGHKIGDDVLVEIARVLTQNIRKTDILGRWGGEEFLIICPQTTQDEALHLATKINRAVASYDFSTYEKQVTVSIGVCEYEKEFDIEKMLLYADEALYLAKQNGRNRVEVHA
jgi:diguanylate cyclase (GGDEF)-like protein